LLQQAGKTNAPAGMLTDTQIDRLACSAVAVGKYQVVGTQLQVFGQYIYILILAIS